MIENIETRPYLLKNSIQNYAWGTKGKESFIPQLLGFSPEENTPYAELWIGAHPKAPSKVVLSDENTCALDELIREFPQEILGEYVVQKFGKTLPYLLKVLSINQALSIQVHPSKTLAKVLNKKDPENYPDNNHKPEIAIAIDHLQAIVGFKPVNEIRNVLEEYRQLIELIGDVVVTGKAEQDGEWLKKIYSSVMLCPQDKLSSCIESIKAQIESKEVLNEGEKQFLLQYENYGVDAGLISILLFNMVSLDPGKAIFTKDGVPHAYIKGNIVECMANSDNVVRAGLTPKFKDVDTLLDMLNYRGEKPEVFGAEDKNVTMYDTPAEEFQLIKYCYEEETVIDFESNSEILIGLVLDGSVSVEYANECLNAGKGESVLIPAILGQFVVRMLPGTTFYMVKVPHK